MKYSAIDTINSVLSSSFNYWHTATSVWFSRIKEKKEDPSLARLEEDALALVGTLYDKCLAMDGLERSPESLLSQIFGSMNAIHLLVVRCVIFEALASYDDCPPEIQHSLAGGRKTLEEIEKLLQRNGYEMAGASIKALEFIQSIDDSHAD